jgi:hypothetical protein
MTGKSGAYVCHIFILVDILMTLFSSVDALRRLQALKELSKLGRYK